MLTLKASLPAITASTFTNTVSIKTFQIPNSHFYVSNNSSGNLTEGCKTAGPHFNPHGQTHAGPTDSVRHVGDLGNLHAGEDGTAHYELEDHLIHLHGEFSIIGRSCVTHAGVDDLGLGGNEESLKTGNAGGRLACGVIGLSAPF